MKTAASLLGLLHLASPALPVGAFSYSQGLEAAIESGAVRDAATTGSWIHAVLALSLARGEGPLLLRLMAAWSAHDVDAAHLWNEEHLATRETRELRAETVQMGYSLRRLLIDLMGAEAEDLDAFEELGYTAAFAFAATRWELEPESALVAYLWSWAENQVLAAVKTVPLGQTDGQRLLRALAPAIAAAATTAGQLGDDQIENFAPGLALASARHEVQYSRLFRS